MASMASYSAASVEPRSKCHDCLKVSRSVASFLLSHIGLLSLVVGYCIMGAVIFEELEKHNEILTKRAMKAKRLAMTDKLWDITWEMDILHKENWTRAVTSSLKKFEKSLIIALKEDGWDGKEDETTVTWTFAGALFYSITVITTIGYGHIAPKTPLGKIVTIFYAILGIPLTVLCWSNIGDAMANAFRFTYWKICCYVYVKKSKKRKKRLLNRQRAMSMRHPAGLNRARSMRRTQRPSQRSADSKLTTQTGDSKLTSGTVDSRGTDSTSYSDAERFEEHTDLPLAARGRNPKRSTVDQEAGKQLQGASPSLQLQAVPALPSLQAQGAPPDSLQLQPPPGGFLDAPRSCAEEGGPPPLQVPGPGAPAGEELAGRPQEVGGKPQELGGRPGPSAKERWGRGLSRAVLRAEKESVKSAASGASAGSGGSPGPPPLAPLYAPPLAPLYAAPLAPLYAAPLAPLPQVSRGHQQPRPVARLAPDHLPPGGWGDDQSYYEEEYYYEDDDSDVDDYSRKPVPILLSILLVIIYIVGGAFLFQMWEGWLFLDSAYFCFITLTTIGFGDLTPDQKMEDGETRIALCSLYLLFGIAMIAMSFNLVQEEVINSVKSVGKMLGIIKDPDEDEDY